MKLSLYECRVIAKLTQQQVADHLGIHIATYRRYETEYPKKMEAGSLFDFCELVNQSVANIDLTRV